MPKRLEEALKRRAAQLGYTGERRERYVYGTLQKRKEVIERERKRSDAAKTLGER